MRLSINDIEVVRYARVHGITLAEALKRLNRTTNDTSSFVEDADGDW